MMNIEGREPEQEPISIETIRADIDTAMKEVATQGMFTETYLREAQILFPDQSLVFSRGAFSSSERPGLDLVEDSMLGTDSRYVNMIPKKQLDDFVFEESGNAHFSQGLFTGFDVRFPYDEVLAHEMGHNIFDLAYIDKFGPFEVYDLRNKAGIIEGKATDVAEQYKEEVQTRLGDLFERAGVPLDVKRFALNRRKITEILAFLIEREYASRDPKKMIWHKTMNERTKEFVNDPMQCIQKTNEQKSRNISLEDVYQENHNLSFIVAYAFDKLQTPFRERLTLFDLDLGEFIK